MRFGTGVEEGARQAGIPGPSSGTSLLGQAALSFSLVCNNSPRNSRLTSLSQPSAVRVKQTPQPSAYQHPAPLFFPPSKSPTAESSRAIRRLPRPATSHQSSRPDAKPAVDSRIYSPPAAGSRLASAAPALQSSTSARHDSKGGRRGNDVKGALP